MGRIVTHRGANLVRSQFVIWTNDSFCGIVSRCKEVYHEKYT